MAESIKLIIKTNPATINVGANIPVSIGKDSSFNPAIQFKATGSSGNKGDTGLTGLAGATYIHPTNHAISVITGLQTALNGKVNISQVLTNVPANALFTDTNINTQLPLIDSDAMTGASATNVASAESVKAYVDGAVIANTDTQDLSISGQTLSLTSGGSVTLPDTNTQLDNAGVIGKVLTGLNVGTTADVVAADTIVVAIGKLENRVATNDDKATDVNHNVTTNLSVSTSVTTVIVNSSDGTNATIPVATTSIGGVMSKAIFDEHTDNVAKNTNVSTDLGITGDTGARVITSSDGTNATIPVATTSVSGLLTPSLFDEIDANTAKTSNIVQATITGNAGTATALTSGDKTINGDLNLSGATNKLIINATETVQVASGVVTIGQSNRVLNLSASTLIVPNIDIGALADTTIERVSPGVVSIEGNTIATTNKVIDTKVAAYHSGYLNTGYYITLSGASTSESTALSTSSYTSIFVVPYDGKVLRISSHSQSSTSKSSTLEMYIDGDDSNLTTSQRGTDVSTGTYNKTFTVDCSSDWTFSKGETIAIRRTDTDELYGTSMTVVFEYDTTT